MATATKFGFILDGWYTASSGGSKINEQTKPSDNVTYYAHWTNVKGFDSGTNRNFQFDFVLDTDTDWRSAIRMWVYLGITFRGTTAVYNEYSNTTGSV